jgi:hypothetical protein
MTEAILIENLKTMLLKIQDRRHVATDDDKWENFQSPSPKLPSIQQTQK